MRALRSATTLSSSLPRPLSLLAESSTPPAMRPVRLPKAHYSAFSEESRTSISLAAGSFPIPATLGGSSVTITQDGQPYNAWVEYASAGQVNAILPSDVPVGNAQLTVTYNGQTSLPVTFKVATTSFGVFFTSANGADAAIAQNYVSPSIYPLNQPSMPAMPGQVVLVWGRDWGRSLRPIT